MKRQFDAINAPRGGSVSRRARRMVELVRGVDSEPVGSLPAGYTGGAGAGGAWPDRSMRDEPEVYVPNGPGIETRLATAAEEAEMLAYLASSANPVDRLDAAQLRLSMLEAHRARTARELPEWHVMDRVRYLRQYKHSLESAGPHATKAELRALAMLEPFYQRNRHSAYVAKRLRRGVDAAGRPVTLRGQRGYAAQIYDVWEQTSVVPVANVEGTGVVHAPVYEADEYHQYTYVATGPVAGYLSRSTPSGGHAVFMGSYRDEDGMWRTFMLNQNDWDDPQGLPIDGFSDFPFGGSAGVVTVERPMIERTHSILCGLTGECANFSVAAAAYWNADGEGGRSATRYEVLRDLALSCDTVHEFVSRLDALRIDELQARGIRRQMESVRQLQLELAALPVARQRD